MLLKPKKGTQGRDMHQKTKIASALISALALTAAAFALAPSLAFAGSPLLSGYGGPGAGEQAILGSTLLGGQGGGSGSGGPSGGSTGEGGGTGAASSSAAAGGSFAPSSSPSGTGSARAGEVTGKRRLHGGLSAPRGAGIPARTGSPGVSAYVYPSTLRAALYDSPALGISGGDLLAVVATIATLALLGVLTIRLGRLQS